MIIMLLGALVALVFGRISITRTWKLKGKFARLFGLTLLLLAFPVSIILSVLLTLLAPELIAGNGVESLILNLLLTVMIVGLIAYPFVVWQRKEGNTGDKTSMKWAAGTIGVFLLLVILGVIVLFRKGGDALQELTKQNDEGVAAGSAAGVGKTVKECFALFKERDPFFKNKPGDIDPKNIQKALDETVKAGGFLDGCMSVSSDQKEFCDLIPKEPSSHERKVWSEKICADFAIPTSECEMNSSNLALKCALASLSSLRKK